MAIDLSETRTPSNDRGGRPPEPPNQPAATPPRTPAWFWKALALSLGLVAGFVVAEVSLRVAGLPRFHKSHTTPPQFMFFRDTRTDKLFHVNMPSTGITFVYDSDPRGYFGTDRSVVHNTNSGGFRGREFDIPKPPNTIRLAFLGDSFTFGEGVRDEDTFAEVTGRLLTQRFGGRGVNFQCYNFGVGGYNTANAAFLLRLLVLQVRPDVLVLCYGLNDAEPPLFDTDEKGDPVRRVREQDVPEGVATPRPPDTLLYRSRVAQLVWRFFASRGQNRQTESYYHALYRPDAPGWKATREALDEIVDICRWEKIPLVVMLFPVLHRLDGQHPFSDLHALVRGEVVSRGGQVLDLLPAFQGKRAEDLWVHPTDQHPNEQGHRLAAERLAEYLATRGDVTAKIEEAAGR